MGSLIIFNPALWFNCVTQVGSSTDSTVCPFGLWTLRWAWSSHAEMSRFSSLCVRPNCPHSPLKHLPLLVSVSWAVLWSRHKYARIILMSGTILAVKGALDTVLVKELIQCHKCYPGVLYQWGFFTKMAVVAGCGPCEVRIGGGSLAVTTALKTWFGRKSHLLLLSVPPCTLLSPASEHTGGQAPLFSTMFQWVVTEMRIASPGGFQLPELFPPLSCWKAHENGSSICSPGTLLFFPPASGAQDRVLGERGVGVTAWLHWVM